MSRRGMRQEAPSELAITDLSHDGRGVARTAEGKAIFVRGALPGERVLARRTARSRHFDEAEVLGGIESLDESLIDRAQLIILYFSMVELV